MITNGLMKNVIKILLKKKISGSISYEVVNANQNDVKVYAAGFELVKKRNSLLMLLENLI